jgi:hypothetical protein
MNVITSVVEFPCLAIFMPVLGGYIRLFISKNRRYEKKVYWIDYSKLWKNIHIIEYSTIRAAFGTEGREQGTGQACRSDSG